MAGTRTHPHSLPGESKNRDGNQIRREFKYGGLVSAGKIVTGKEKDCWAKGTIKPASRTGWDDSCKFPVNAAAGNAT
jgi:hypothetical protein